jgi:hypothetical protein
MYQQTQMHNELKDTATVVGANAGALGLTLTECNEMLTLISLLLAIGYTCFKIFRILKK